MDEKNEMSTSARSSPRYTYGDFLRFPDDGKRHEIIDGVHYVTPSPNTRHQDLVGRLYFAIALDLRDHPEIGRLFLSPFDVVFSNWDVVEPDLLFIAGDQLDILTDKNVQGPPALVIEILSRGTRKRDEQIKRRLFARTGVREYWLVDPELDRISVHRRTSTGAFPLVAELTVQNRDMLSTPLLPAFSLPLVELFRPR